MRQVWAYLKQHRMGFIAIFIICFLLIIISVQAYKGKKAERRAYYSGMYDAECPSQAEHERKLKEGRETALEDSCDKGFKECEWECFAADDRYRCKKACEAGLKACAD